MEQATFPSHIKDVTRVTGLGKKGLGQHQCTRIKLDGERCENNPTPGAVVCSLHGGKDPNVQRQARLRLLETVMPAISCLLRAINEDCAPMETNPAWCKIHGSTCPEWNVRVSAAKALMDRAGYGPQSKITVEKPDEDLTQIDKAALAAELETLSRQLRMNEAEDADLTRVDTDARTH